MPGQVGQQHDELVATPARQRVARAQAAAQCVGQVQQHLVPRLVAKLVVDMLEMVQVHETQCHPASGALGTAQGNLAAVLQQHAVGQAGERIVQGHVRHVLFHQVALRDVAQHTTHTAHRHGTELADHKAVFHPHVLAIGTPQADAATQAGLFAGEQLRKVQLEIAHIIGMEALEQTAAVAACGPRQARPARTGAQVAANNGSPVRPA